MAKKYVNYESIIDAVCVKYNRKKYILFIKRKFLSCNALNFTNFLYIVSYSGYKEEKPQLLLEFMQGVNVKLAYDGKYVYISEYGCYCYDTGELFKYELSKVEDTFSISKVEHMNHADYRRYREMISEDCKVAAYDEITRNIYKISDGKIKFMLHCKKANISNICFIDGKLEFNKKPCEETFCTLKQYEDIVNLKEPLGVLELTEFGETAFATINSLVFEKDGKYSGIIWFDDKTVSCITTNLSGGIVAIVDGNILVINKSDIERLKTRSAKELLKSREKVKRIIKLIAICSGYKKENFFNFSNEFKKRGHHMLKDMEILYKAGFSGDLAWRVYNDLQK